MYGELSGIVSWILSQVVRNQGAKNPKPFTNDQENVQGVAKKRVYLSGLKRSQITCSVSAQQVLANMPEQANEKGVLVERGPMG